MSAVLASFVLSLAFGAPPVETSLKVLILPTIDGEKQPREPRLGTESLRAFSNALGDAASNIFSWRRWSVVSSEDAQNASAMAKVGECRSESCALKIAKAAGATHVLFSRLTRLKDGTCTTVIWLENVLKNERTAALREEIRPCTADNLLSTAEDLGHRIADGPRAPLQATISLTPLELDPLDIPNIPDISDFRVATSTKSRTRRGGLALDRALELYKAKHMFVFNDPDRRGVFYIARDRRIINDCDVRRAASAPITHDMLEFCEGNSWEYAWIGFPVGLLIAGLGANNLSDGGFFTFIFGSAIAVGAAVIALVFNVDAAVPEDGTHYSSREELEQIVHKSNRQLREVLDLTEAEVTIAGMNK